MQNLYGTIQHYPWGTKNYIPEIIGIAPDGRPHAEYWLGAHPSSPSALGRNRIALDKHLTQHPEELGEKALAVFGPQLSFLMKILSAEQPLSIQTHPSRSQAEDGFARQDAENIPLNSPRRIYRDPWPKPELIIALTEFHALSGFREPKQTMELFDGLGVADRLTSVIGPLAAREGSSALAEVFLDILSLGEERQHLVDEVCAAAVNHRNNTGALGDFARTAIELDSFFPGEPGILAALLLNRITLKPGETLFMNPGQLHAYIKGTGIEVMGNSDNVIRGGLTKKHIDINELVQVVEFTSRTPEISRGVPMGPGLEIYRTPCKEFQTWRITPSSSSIALPRTDSARILVTIGGAVRLMSNTDTLDLASGESAYLPAEKEIYVTGSGQVYMSACGAQ